VEEPLFVFIRDEKTNASTVEEPLFVFIRDKEANASTAREPLFVFIREKEANASIVIYPIIYIQLLPVELKMQKFHEMESQQLN